jgi:hypothetical protein
MSYPNKPENDGWTMTDEEWEQLTKDQQGDWVEYWSNQDREEEETK